MTEIGFRVIAVENSAKIRDGVIGGRPHFMEVGLIEKLSNQIASNRLTIHECIPKNCIATVYIITVGTPIGQDKKAKLDGILKTAEEIAEHLKEGDLVVLRSTVKVGVTRNVVLPVLEKVGVQFDLAVCPERTLEGRALQELRTLPQIVGGLTQQSTLRSSQLFNFLTPTVVRVRDLETAEITKLINNTQRDLMFAFANEVAGMCDTLGVSATEVIFAGNIGYPRSNLPLPGPVGGPCLEKDPHILAESLAEHGYHAELTLSGRLLNERLPERTVQQIYECTLEWPEEKRTRPVIAVLGLAFKGQPETDDLRGTMAVPILAALKERFAASEFRGYDPVVVPEEVEELGLKSCVTLQRAFDGASIVVIQNNHVAFTKMPLTELAQSMAAPAIIYDYWNHFAGQELELPEGIRYVGLGNFGRTVESAATAQAFGAGAA